MDVDTLAEVYSVGESFLKTDISKLIYKACGKPVLFTHSEPVLGTDHSIRIMYQEASGQGQDLQYALRPSDVAEELVTLTAQSARYPEEHTPGQCRGWRIEKFDCNGHVAIIAHAAWV